MCLIQPKREVLGVVVTFSGRDVERHLPEHLLRVWIGRFQFSHGLKKLFAAETHDRFVVELQDAEGMDVVFRCPAFPVETFGHEVRLSVLLHQSLQHHADAV